MASMAPGATEQQTRDALRNWGGMNRRKNAEVLGGWNAMGPGRPMGGGGKGGGGRPRGGKGGGSIGGILGTLGGFDPGAPQRKYMSDDRGFGPPELVGGGAPMRDGGPLRVMPKQGGGKGGGVRPHPAHAFQRAKQAGTLLPME